MEVKFVRNPKLEYNIGNICISEFLMKIPPSLSYKNVSLHKVIYSIIYKVALILLGSS